MFKYLLAIFTACMFLLLGLSLTGLIDTDRNSLLWVTAFMLGGTAWSFRPKRGAGTTFVTWARQNKAAIQSGTASYKGTNITPATEMVQYSGVISILVLTIVAPTDHYVLGSPQAKRMRLASTVFSAFLGWWGFPWGIVRTPKAIHSNLTNQYRVTVAQLLQ